MFTGLIESVGSVRQISPVQVVINVPAQTDPWIIGESVAINGVCLTLVNGNESLHFEISEETLRRTALSELQVASTVNIERAMKLGARLGGHMVQGHVDGVGVFVGMNVTPQAHVMRFSAPSEYSRYLIDKGSIAINGISLTVVHPKQNEFEVWIVPHTWANTMLHTLEPGQRVNMEFDMIAKYVERLLGTRLTQEQ